tara:strand:- start:236 stop:1030 length:795 start_codon:yes stop_codon:yes gene_type:complete
MKKNKFYIKILSLLVFGLSYNLNLFSHNLEEAVKSMDRDPKNVSRDIYRNPYETLSFFEIKSNMKIIELSPGGGWYTEILANFIHDPGILIAAHYDPNSDREYFKKMRANFESKINENSMYDNVKIVNLYSELAEAQSVDAVLTFRNLHNWLGSQADVIFANAYRALKKGGILGVVEHRADPGTTLEVMKKSGYVTEEYAIKIAKKHGFILVSKSEINANPLDTKDHPRGVWTLPPSMRLKDQDKDKYLKIGESDRMTLLFKKL